MSCVKAEGVPGEENNYLETMALIDFCWPGILHAGFVHVAFA